MDMRLAILPRSTRTRRKLGARVPGKALFRSVVLALRQQRRHTAGSPVGPGRSRRGCHPHDARRAGCRLYRPEHDPSAAASALPVSSWAFSRRPSASRPQPQVRMLSADTALAHARHAIPNTPSSLCARARGAHIGLCCSWTAPRSALSRRPTSVRRTSCAAPAAPCQAGVRAPPAHASARP